MPLVKGIPLVKGMPLTTSYGLWGSSEFIREAPSTFSGVLFVSGIPLVNGIPFANILTFSRLETDLGLNVYLTYTKNGQNVIVPKEAGTYTVSSVYVQLAVPPGTFI